MRRGESYYWLEGAKEVPVTELLGRTVTSLEMLEDGEELRFFCSDKTAYFMYHEQCCCESVRIEDICGELEYLLDSPILMAEEVKGESGMDKEEMEHYTWTFYKFATRKGYVTLRWLGTSNGYYGEEVSLMWIPAEYLTPEGWVRERPPAGSAGKEQNTVLCRVETESWSENFYASVTLPAWAEQYGFPAELEVGVEPEVLANNCGESLERQVETYLRDVYLPNGSEIVIEDQEMREAFRRRLSACEWKVWRRSEDENER